MKYCSNCVYPIVAVNLDLGEDGVCSSCKSFEQFEQLAPEFWADRRRRFEQVIEQVRKNNTGGYDCIVPVGGGEESYYQTPLMAAEGGLKPIPMTYHGKKYL